MTETQPPTSDEQPGIRRPPTPLWFSVIHYAVGGIVLTFLAVALILDMLDVVQLLGVADAFFILGLLMIGHGVLVFIVGRYDLKYFVKQPIDRIETPGKFWSHVVITIILGIGLVGLALYVAHVADDIQQSLNRVRLK